jgi:TrkA domain protein
LGIRKKTGATIIAIVKRDQVKIINPGPEQTIREGATLVMLGERAKVKACKQLIQQGSI